MEDRNITLAKNLINYSCKLQKNEKVLIEVRGTSSIPLVREIIKEVYKVGATPFTIISDETVQRELLMNATKEQLDIMAETDGALMRQMDAYIGITAPRNIYETSDVPAANTFAYSKYYTKPVHIDLRLEETKWVVLRYPNEAYAQAAGMSLDAFTDFYYNVCNLDYKKLSKAMDSLVDIMQKTDKVHITGPGTDLQFSIKDIPVIKCDGALNIPDGEVYSAPVKHSVNGYLTYNTPSMCQGFEFKDVYLEFKDGKIINATSNDTKRINDIFDLDEGARYIGEFAIGVNPYVTRPIKDTLFDEKICGSFHFTPGNAYDDAFNGNKSGLHWDLVCIQTKEYGGGKIYFDDVLIRSDGIFIIEELKCLNPENLILLD